MLIDLTLKFKIAGFLTDDPIRKFGHIGTHFDTMNKEFTLENIKRSAIIIDIRHIKNREIGIQDIKVDIQKNDFVIFKTNIIKEYTYGTKEYLSRSAELSDELLDYLIERKISLIGVDAAGVQKVEKHPRADKYLAENDIFVIENLCNLDIVQEKIKKDLTIYCFPLNLEVGETTGLPCRVVAEC